MAEAFSYFAMPEPARDVLAKRVETWADTEDWKVYDYVDRLLSDLDAAGYEIVRRDDGFDGAAEFLEGLKDD